MPYIDQDQRAVIDQDIDELLQHVSGCTVGELNYLITRILSQWVFENNTNYSNINSVIGVLECAKLEFYRRLAAPYEDKKIEQNGDVYA